METDWTKYLGIPYKHLGIDPIKGIDCFNLIKHIYDQELNIEIPYTTRTFCDILDENWYSRTHEKFFEDSRIFENGWEKTNKLEPFCGITMVMGSSNITNHCALYIGNNRILHTLQNHKSHIAVYGSYYKQYTMGVYKWIGMKT
jgi:cell wall-associated NlpC family hydrolase